jgi:hypothetical protein
VTSLFDTAVVNRLVGLLASCDTSSDTSTAVNIYHGDSCNGGEWKSASLSGGSRCAYFEAVHSTSKSSGIGNNCANLNANTVYGQYSYNLHNSVRKLLVRNEKYMRNCCLIAHNQ